MTRFSTALISGELPWPVPGEVLSSFNSSREGALRWEGVVLAAEEGAAYGAALLAGVGSGVWSTVDEACDRVVRVAETRHPVPEHVTLLDERYNRFRTLYRALHPPTPNDH